MDPLDLNWRHLRSLPVIAEHGGIGAAAEFVGMTQPALTQAVAKLENRLGVRLFDRSPSGMTATAAGDALIARIGAAEAEIAGAVRDVRGGRSRGFASPELLITSAQMRVLLAFVDAGGQAAAARSIGLSQPSIHRALRDLEGIFGLTLTDRRGVGVSPSPAGRMLGRGIRLAMVEASAGLAEILGPSAEGTVTIGAMPLIRARVLPAAVAAFHVARSDVHVRVIEGSWRELVEPLADGTLDLMVGALRDDAPSDLLQAPLLRDGVAIVARAGHALSDHRPDLTDLRQAAWIVAPPGAPLRRRWETLFGNGERPVAAIECGSAAVIAGILERTDLLALLSPDQVALPLETGLLRTLDLKLDDAVRSIGVVARRQWRPSPAQRTFLKALYQAAGTDLTHSLWRADTSNWRPEDG